MKTFKIIDCVLQVLLILGSVFVNLAPRTSFVNDLIYSYVLVGGWQMISVLVHLFIPAEYKVGLRKVYSVLLLITAVLFAIMLLSGNGLDALAGLLFWSPVLAILYVTACLFELKKLNPSVS